MDVDVAGDGLATVVKSLADLSNKIDKEWCRMVLPNNVAKEFGKVVVVPSKMVKELANTFECCWRWPNPEEDIEWPDRNLAASLSINIISIINFCILQTFKK